MSWPGQEDHVQVVLLDQSVQMNVDKREARARAPVSQEPILDVLVFEGLSQKRVALEINHPKAQVVASSPICMGLS
jgi:hypothetical protein